MLGDMKRFNDSYGGAISKRPRMGPDDIEIRVLIPSKVAGSIIGKGGNNIARLRNDFTAKVLVPDCPGPERILTVISDMENAIKVVNEVLPNLEDEYGGGRKRRAKEAGDGADGDNGDTGEEVDVRLLVHQSQAGCIIGKGGSKVKQLREKTGARIKIYSNCCPDSTDRVVQINGKADVAISCVKEVLDLITTQAPIKGPDSPYDPNNYDDYYAEEYGGYGLGVTRGPPMRGGDGGGRGRYGPRGPPMGGPRGFGGGYGGGQGDEDMGAPAGAARMMGGRGPIGRGGNMGNGSGPSARSSTQVTIPKDLAGAIIGKAGARIRKVRIDSGADITIDEPLPGSNDRIITISGLPNQIQMAQYLLQQSVHQNSKSPAALRRY